MKKLFMILSAVAALFIVAACEQEETKLPVAGPDRIYLPRDNYPVDLATGADIIFEWEATKSGNAVYQILFDTADGDFSEPLYIISSDDNGFRPSAKVSALTMSMIVKFAGCLPGETVPIKWIVKTLSGLDSVVGYGKGYEPRTLLVTRANGMDPLPNSLIMSGNATENGGEIHYAKALPISTTKGGFIKDREKGCMECFTQMKPGSIILYDDYDRYYTLSEETGKIYEADQATESTLTLDGVYWIYIDFNTMSWKAREFESVIFWTHPWFAGEDTAPTAYVGNGCWNITDYAWQVGTIAGQHDTRYHFNVTYKDGFTERWAYWDDDCRENAAPDDNPIFYNVYRFTGLTDDWAHSWKSKSDVEGVEGLATFTIHMNNTDGENYFHERSFK